MFFQLLILFPGPQNSRILMECLPSSQFNAERSEASFLTASVSRLPCVVMIPYAAMVPCLTLPSGSGREKSA